MINEIATIVDFRGGYLKVSLAVNRLFNCLLSIILIICSLPLFLIISILIKLQDGGPVFYNSIRLGFNKKPFMMYKFRTLIPDADKIIGAEVLSAKHREVVTPLGKFLRNSRFDELPQLFNILKGEMDFVGPRPQRPEIVEKICKHIKGYEERFSVRPGLIGFPQLFLPHSSPKRIQSIVDNKYVKIKQKISFDICIVSYTIFIVMRITFYRTVRYIWNSILKSKILGKYKEKRTLERVKTEEARVYIGSKNSDKEIFTGEAKLVDINEEAFLIYTDHKIDQNSLLYKIEIDYETHRGRKRKKSALCTGIVYRESEIKHNQFNYSYVIKYAPVSSLNYYIVHQYFLFEAMA